MSRIMRVYHVIHLYNLTKFLIADLRFLKCSKSRIELLIVLAAFSGDLHFDRRGRHFSVSTLRLNLRWLWPSSTSRITLAFWTTCEHTFPESKLFIVDVQYMLTIWASLKTMPSHGLLSDGSSWSRCSHTNLGVLITFWHGQVFPDLRSLIVDPGQQKSAPLHHDWGQWLKQIRDFQLQLPLFD